MNNLGRIILISGAVVSYLLGAGTATGQEILQFFVAFGYYGIGGVLIAAVLHTWFGAYVMDVGYRLEVDSVHDVFKYFCGKYIGTFLTWFAQLFIIVVLIVMISGAGSTFNEYYGMNITLGKFIMASLVLATALLGLRGLVNILGVAGPIIIVLAVIVGAMNFNVEGFMEAGKLVESLNITKGTSTWWQSGVVYSSFVLLIAVPFLAKIGQTEKKRMHILLGGGLGGMLMLVVAGVLYLGIFSNVEVTATKDIPALFLAEQISSAFGFIYSIILLIAIYTTAAGMLWIGSDFLSRGNVKYQKIIAVILTIIGFFGGLFPFAEIINTVYPIVGYMGIVIFIGMVYRQFINKGEIGSDKANVDNDHE